MKHLKRNLVAAILTVFMMVTAVVAQPKAAFAAGGWSDFCVVTVDTRTKATDNTPKGQAAADASGEVFQVATIQGVQCLIANILSVAITVIGLAGFVMFIVGSFTYLLSGGNSKGIEGARSTFTFAVIGLVVALSAVIILRIVAGFTGVQGILNFKLPNSCDGLPAGTGCQ